MLALHPDLLFRDGVFVAEYVIVDAAGRIAGYSAHPPPAVEVVELPGIALLPGFVNGHSHAFQRLLRGVAERPEPGAPSSFWTWRQAMYALVEALDPDTFELIARATFREMLLAGYTRVKEFHYLHHGPGGVPYADPHEMALRLVAAAADAGIALEIERVLYLDAEGPAQARFRDRDLDTGLALTDSLRARAGVPVGIAPHSVRAVDARGFRAAAHWAERNGAEIHAHVAEQPKEVEQCLARTGRRPLELLAEAGALSPRFHGVHLTHLSRGEVQLAGAAGITACLCPSTEANLGDGVPEWPALARSGARLAIGSDSQAHIDPFLELRTLEYNERLRRGERCVLDPGSLLAATTEPAAAFDPARFVLLDLNAPSLAATPPEFLASAVVMAAGRDAVAGLWIGRARVQPEVRSDWLTAARARLR